MKGSVKRLDKKKDKIDIEEGGEENWEDEDTKVLSEGLSNCNVSPKILKTDGKREDDDNLIDH